MVVRQGPRDPTASTGRRWLGSHLPPGFPQNPGGLGVSQKSGASGGAGPIQGPLRAPGQALRVPGSPEAVASRFGSLLIPGRLPRAAPPGELSGLATLTRGPEPLGRGPQRRALSLLLPSPPSPSSLLFLLFSVLFPPAALTLHRNLAHSGDTPTEHLLGTRCQSRPCETVKNKGGKDCCQGRACILTRETHSVQKRS